ncbi:IQ domain-containing protein IQM1 [Ceratocystis fimbriata CBS 114723]|uniref:IQ domain-containing protein IQM1 n=1 Tax=Ceratocystis fimbriata CBS 114723 TaxID=1035309 RepID=A0A2C5X4F2_9PEZI|nr:IQ domain-containing protein IQM1 [Ceratocystis fimbriata CBS 114723]
MSVLQSVTIAPVSPSTTGLDHQRISSMALSPDLAPNNQDHLDSPKPPNSDHPSSITHNNEAAPLESIPHNTVPVTATSPSPSPSENERLGQAAELIQRTYRGYRTRREINGMTINASSRFISTVHDAQFRNRMTPHARSESNATGPSSPSSPRNSDAAARWRKAGAVFQRAGNDIEPDSDSDPDSSDSSADSSENDSPTVRAERAERRRKREEAKLRRKNQAMMMNISYFLEMVDIKHRYGGNLLIYHNEWKYADTNENFFYWLDSGSGKDLDLDSCPRERLNRECVRYLSREERQYYLVKFDKDGRLRWAKNNELLNTTEEYRDSTKGIVPKDDPTPGYSAGPDTTLVTGAVDGSDAVAQGILPRRDSASSSLCHSPRSSLSEDQDEGHRRYPRPVPEAKHGKKPSKTRHIKSSHFSTTAVLNKLMRKSVRKNTWIFVADTRFRLYVGIKMSGIFQHSSFLQGSRIAAAGLIQVKDGQLTSLSPLSGHYRPPAANYKHFIKNLKLEGVDLSHLKVSKAYVILASLETYIKTKEKSKHFLERLVGQKPKEEEDAELTTKAKKKT